MGGPSCLTNRLLCENVRSARTISRLDGGGIALMNAAVALITSVAISIRRKNYASVAAAFTPPLATATPFAPQRVVRRNTVIGGTRVSG